MTYDQYWHGDVLLVRAYRKAYEYRLKQQNFDAWLQGLYFYRALCDVSPILHAFAKKGAKPNAYLSKPVPLFEKDDFKEEKSNQEEKESLWALAYMKNMVQAGKNWGKNSQNQCQVPDTKSAKCQVPDAK